MILEQYQKRQTKARLIAFYLPQYHSIPENDQWWGKGFTEWTNVTKAKPLFRGHHQPNLPADLGFYDLRVPETRIAQAELAKEHGIEGFCYWHYWFGNGKRLLERPFNEVLKSDQPNFPFCLGWANHTWSGIWDGCPDRILIEQTYPGKADYKAHFEAVVTAFADDRYMKVDGKPIFVIFQPNCLPNSVEFTDYWRELAIEVGFPGLYLVGLCSDLTWNPQLHGFDAFTSHPPRDIAVRIPKNFFDRVSAKLRRHLSLPIVYDYKTLVAHAIPEVPSDSPFLPTIVPNWDNTPRSGINGVIFQHSTPELFRQKLSKAIQFVAPKPAEEQIIFIKSWNEWAEGNYLEPDRRFGKAYLEAIKVEMTELNGKQSPKLIQPEMASKK